MSKVQIMNLGNGTSEPDLKKFVLNIHKYDELLKTLSHRFDRDVLIYVLSRGKELGEILKSESEIKSMFEDFKNGRRRIRSSELRMSS